MNQDSTLAKRMMFIILTDFFCWFPVIIISILALTGNLYDPSKQVYAWIAVFVLPINSSINPLLYTFSTPYVRKKIPTASRALSRSRGGRRGNCRCPKRISWVLNMLFVLWKHSQWIEKSCDRKAFGPFWKIDLSHTDVKIPVTSLWEMYRHYEKDLFNLLERSCVITTWKNVMWFSNFLILASFRNSQTLFKRSQYCFKSRSHNYVTTKYSSVHSQAGYHRWRIQRRWQYGWEQFYRVSLCYRISRQDCGGCTKFDWWWTRNHSELSSTYPVLFLE